MPLMNHTASSSNDRTFFQVMVNLKSPRTRRKTKALNQANSYLLKDPSYSIRIYPTIEEVPQEWDHLIEDQNLFQKREYLEVIEAAPPKAIAFAYVLFYHNNRPIGLSINQVISFNITENINAPNRQEKKGFLNRTGQKLQTAVTKRLNFRLLVGGNMLLTGEHGFFFLPKACTAKKAYNLLEESMFKVLRYVKKQGVAANGFMIKDVSIANQELTKTWIDHSCHEIAFQPNMILQLRADWNTFEDYLAAMSSKYRVRVRRARKKGKNLERRELDITTIQENNETLIELYKNIANKAGFNIIELHPNYFIELKRRLPKQFHLFGYYLNEELIGFNTAIFNGKELEAHFLGFKEENNPPHQLYLNMLYDIIDLGLEMGNIEDVIFARTAMEIKSSVGAEPHDFFCYFRHPNNLTNRFVPYLINYFEPKVEWQARHPFKSKTEKEY